LRSTSGRQKVGQSLPNLEIFVKRAGRCVQVTGRKADAVLAAHLASEAALRLVKPGNESYEVTDTVSKIAEAFKCKVKLILRSGLWIKNLLIRFPDSLTEKTGCLSSPFLFSWGIGYTWSSDLTKITYNVY
jgi:hypothetical protein